MLFVSELFCAARQEKENVILSQSSSGGKRHLPRSKFGKVLFNLAVTLVIGAIYFYVSLPALNLQSGDFYSFIGLLCIVYVISALITSG